MADRDVVALEVVVGEVLPVVRVLGDQRALGLEPCDAERLEPLARVAEPLGERRQVGVERDEHEPGQRLDAERRQAHALAVERGEAARLGDGRELAVLAVRPAVVGAAQDLRARPGPVQDLHGAVAADVRERAQHAVVAAHDRDRLAGDVGGRERAGRRDDALGADEDPRAREDLVELGLVDLALDVGARRQRVALLVGDAHRAQLAMRSRGGRAHARGHGRCRRAAPAGRGRRRARTAARRSPLVDRRAGAGAHELGHLLDPRAVGLLDVGPQRGLVERRAQHLRPDPPALLDRLVVDEIRDHGGLEPLARRLAALDRAADEACRPARRRTGMRAAAAPSACRSSSARARSRRRPSAPRRPCACRRSRARR